MLCEIGVDIGRYIVKVAKLVVAESLGIHSQAI